MLKDMTGGKNSAHPVKSGSVNNIIMVTFVIITLAHISIECYKRGDGMKKVTPYSMGTLRFFTVLILIIGAPLLLFMNVLPSDCRALKKLIFDVIFNFFVLIVIPAWAILKNDKIVTFFRTKILCYHQETMIIPFE